MLRAWWHGKERRRHPRVDAALPIAIEVELYGFRGDVDPFFASGETLNISLGGLLACVDTPVLVDSVCKVFFHDSSGQVHPRHTAARVIRCDERGDGLFVVAAEFETPLSRLKVEQRVTVAATR